MQDSDRIEHPYNYCQPKTSQLARGCDVLRDAREKIYQARIEFKGEPKVGPTPCRDGSSFVLRNVA